MHYLKLLIVTVLLLSGSLSAQTTNSYYVTVKDSTKLAIDVHLPENYVNEKLPTLIVLTRYWRSSEDPKTGVPNPALSGLDQDFINNGYAIVKVDVRGTGASFGTRPGEYTPIEVNDAYSVVDWIIKQSWSSGSVGAYGTSYLGTTAELLCAINHPAVKAVIPGWSDFDIYRSPVRPYGMLASGFISEWSQFVEMLDNNASDQLQAAVRRVDAAVLGKALAEHKSNPNVFEMTKNSPYRDSKVGQFTYEECSPIHWKEEISKSNVPMLVLTSWMDAGTADGTLLRLQHFSNPQKVVMMATSHGGLAHASPFVVDDTIIPPLPSIEKQYTLQLDFFDQYLKGKNNHVENWPTIKYYNLGEEVFKESAVWPPVGQSYKKYFFNAEGNLQDNLPEEDEGKDTYTVDFSLSTGTKNRWTTQMGNPVLNLNKRNSSDSLMLTYTSKPLKQNLQITGTPVITLHLSSTHEDGAVFVYLEDVDENGNSRYITEGGMRLIHRKLSQNPQFDQYPYHSFNQADASPMEPNKVEEITFQLWSTSVLIKKGHAIRVAIAGADNDTFDRLPEEGIPTLTIYRSKTMLSFIDLPVIEQ